MTPDRDRINVCHKTTRQENHRRGGPPRRAAAILLRPLPRPQPVVYDRLHLANRVPSELTTNPGGASRMRHATNPRRRDPITRSPAGSSTPTPGDQHGHHDGTNLVARPGCFGRYHVCFDLDVRPCPHASACRLYTVAAWKPFCYNTRTTCSYPKARKCKHRHTCTAVQNPKKREPLHLKHYQHLNSGTLST